MSVLYEHSRRNRYSLRGALLSSYITYLVGIFQILAFKVFSKASNFFGNAAINSVIRPLAREERCVVYERVV